MCITSWHESFTLILSKVTPYFEYERTVEIGKLDLTITKSIVLRNDIKKYTSIKFIFLITGSYYCILPGTQGGRREKCST